MSLPGSPSIGYCTVQNDFHQLTKICVITSNRFTSGHSLIDVGVSLLSDDWDVDGGILPEYRPLICYVVFRGGHWIFKKVQLSDIKTTPSSHLV